MNTQIPDAVSFGERLRQKLAELSADQQTAAREAGVSRSALNAWVRGSHAPQPAKLLQLARYLAAADGHPGDEAAVDQMLAYLTGAEAPATARQQVLPGTAATGDPRAEAFAAYFGDQLRRYGRTQQDVATYTELSPSTISTWARGVKRPDADSINVVAGAWAAFEGVPDDAARIAEHRNRMLLIAGYLPRGQHTEQPGLPAALAEHPRFQALLTALAPAADGQLAAFFDVAVPLATALTQPPAPTATRTAADAPASSPHR